MVSDWTRLIFGDDDCVRTQRLASRWGNAAYHDAVRRLIAFPYFEWHAHREGVQKHGRLQVDLNCFIERELAEMSHTLLWINCEKRHLSPDVHINGSNKSLS